MRTSLILVVLALSLINGGCAETNNQEAVTAGDPLEPMNRFFFDFNQRLDRHAALPAATLLCRQCAQRHARQRPQFPAQSGRPGQCRQRHSEVRIHQCGRSGAPASSSTPRWAWRACSTSPPIGAFASRAAISARRWASMACPKALIWCCRFAAPRRCAISRAIMSMAISRLSISCITLAALCGPGQIHPGLGGQPLRQHRDLSRISSGRRWIITPPCGTIIVSAANGRSRTRPSRPRNLPDF